MIPFSKIIHHPCIPLEENASAKLAKASIIKYIAKRSPSAATPGSGLTMVNAPNATRIKAFSHPSQSDLLVLYVKYPAINPEKSKIHPKKIAEVSDMNVGKIIPTRPSKIKMIPAIFEFFANFCKKSKCAFLTSDICNIVTLLKVFDQKDYNKIFLLCFATFMAFCM